MESSIYKKINKLYSIQGRPIYEKRGGSLVFHMSLPENLLKGYCIK